MTGAMYAAVSGLKTHMSAMNVISNNVSNVNTLGYKATRYTFNEALYSTVRTGSNGTDTLGGMNPAQVGYGCSIGTIDLDMSTKNYNPTGNAMDVMIDGDGFFIVGEDKENNGITKQAQLQGMSLTRLGNFTFDPNGYLVDGNGSLVYGFLRLTSVDEAEQGVNATEEQMTSPVLTPIRLPMCYISGNQATDDQDAEATQNAQKTTTTIFWPRVTSSGEGDSLQQYVEDASTGNLTDTDEEKLPDGVEMENVELTRLQPNSVSIDPTGMITAITKDQQLLVVGYIGIGMVDNPNGVTHIDGRYYQALGGAGNLTVNTIGGAFTYIPPTGDDADQGNQGGEDGLNLGSSKLSIQPAGSTELVTGGLESSGTDLAQEITNMIVIQRGYQANTRIVTVTDTMLEELVNMKR